MLKRARWMVFFFCGCSTLGHASDILEQQGEWMALLLNGSKVGYAKQQRQVYPQRVVTTETVHMSLVRAGTTVTIETSEESIESRDGQPLGFVSRQRISSAEMVIEGSIDQQGRVEVITRSAGSEQRQQFQWDADAVMPEGLRLKLEQQGLRAGMAFTAKLFIPSALQSHVLHVSVDALEKVDIFGTEQTLYRVEQRMQLGQTETISLAWLDNQFVAKKMRLEIMGMQLEGYACPEACATSASEPAEFFAASFARAPQALSASQRDGVITYHIKPKTAVPLNFPSSDEQSVSTDQGVYRLTVRRAKPEPQQSPYRPEQFLSQTQWLQSDAPEIQKLARQARGNATSPQQIMLNLRDFVRRYVADKNLSVGYASALEVARNRSGDCTEHALLLAALGRASGVPTRIATGIAYVDDWLGAEHAFVPHAWTQALIDGQWVSFDAALGRFGAGHIALSYGDGDPWRFYDGVTALGNIDIIRVETSP